MNMQELADKSEKHFFEKIEAKLGDRSKVPAPLISRYCRMLVIYCESEGKVTESFKTSMDKCAQEIIAIDGMGEIFQECNICPEDI